jgi:glycosyltransferase involved in cell wall biosynthesis
MTMRTESETPDVKVLLISPIPPPYGGIAHWTQLVLRYAREQCSGDVEMSVLDTAPRQRRELEVSRLLRVREGVSRMTRDNLRLLGMLRSERPDVVHLNTSGQLAFVRDGLMALILALFGVPFVYHLRFGRVPDMIEGRTLEWRVAKFPLGRAAAVIALDPATEEALRTSGVSRRVVRVPNPTSDDFFVEGETETRREDVVLFVGWVIPAKGVSELLEAWNSIDRQGWTLEIAGPVDDDYMRTLRQRGIPSDVKILGSLDNKAVLERMRSVKVFVLPSHTEGFPNAVLEAMASGAAIVSTSVGAIPDMLRGGAGVIVPPKQTSELAAAIAAFIDDPARARNVGQRALDSARSRFALSAVFPQYVELWNSTSGAKVRGRRR